jgi:hypothetical protein
VYLPGKGVWTDLRTGETFEGGTWTERPSNYGQEPLLLRPGAVLLADLDDRSLSWGRSMTSGKRLCLVASANDPRPSRRVLHVAPGQKMTVTTERSGGEWVLDIKGHRPEIGAFVVYGPCPRTVLWGGRRVAGGLVWSMTTTGPIESWRYEESERAVKIRVPPDAKAQLRIRY